MNSAKFRMAVGIVSTFAILGPMSGLGRAEQGSAPAKPAAASASKTEAPKVDVEVKGLSFSARKPAGWKEDSEAAKKYRVNVVFAPEAPAADNALILVSADHKFDENVALRLQTQIESYRARYPRLEVGDADFKHPEFATFPKMLSQAGDFYQYVAYVNPGTLSEYVFYVSLSTKKTPPTAAETAAFREVLESLQINPPKK